MSYELCPSILSADFNRMGEQLQLLEKSGVRILHIDVMDGMFVPSISFGMPVIRSIRKESGMFFDVHLMIEEPDRYIDEFAKCGADSITVHLEACRDVPAVIQKIRENKVKAAISIKPGTPVESLKPYLSMVDMVLIMTVEPGFGGQKYLDSCTEKVTELRKMAEEMNCSIDIQVDGGINLETMERAMKAGANYLVAGSAVFGDEMQEKVMNFQEAMHKIEAEIS